MICTRSNIYDVLYIGLRTFREILLYNNPDVQNDPKLGEIIQPELCIGNQQQHLGEVKTISRGHYETG